MSFRPDVLDESRRIRVKAKCAKFVALRARLIGDTLLVPVEPYHRTVIHVAVTGIGQQRQQQQSSDMAVPNNCRRIPKEARVTSTAIAKNDDPQRPFAVYNDEFLRIIGNDPTVSVVLERNYDFAHEAPVYDSKEDASEVPPETGIATTFSQM
ncbi:hypothetical protein KC356_g3 [Hortaea werneckii]|nr:hypothetical protein KC356_g3 [Hortaea werneckii]